jgi:hypothetical protein
MLQVERTRLVDETEPTRPLAQWGIDLVVEDVGYVFRQPVHQPVGGLVLPELGTGSELLSTATAAVAAKMPPALNGQLDNAL